ncbi:PDR/VanB family oxidoreductase [Paraburkholderia madseniana]|uniref:PDR/VanB family oxidoreductase n=1 Tax=Paraburkholderia madseniana TaxID=2599607 RepID=UPI0038BCF30B
MNQTVSTIAVRVVRKRVEAKDICSIELADARGDILPAFSAGSHIDVHLPGGLVRQYSLCNHPGERYHYRIGVLRDPNSRGGSMAVHDLVEQGDILHISPPRNHFQLASAERYLMFAGGIGVTPILCMTEVLSRSDSDFTFHYYGRSADRMAFAGHITASAFRDRVRFHLDDETGKPRPALEKVFAHESHGTHLYVCGPTGFINWIVDAAKAAGWTQERIHYEYFSPPVAAPNAECFEIELARSGGIFTVPAEKSVVAVLRENGIDLPVSCEAGVCGTCLTRVLAGDPDHRDVYLTDEEHVRNDRFTPCCSRSLSRRLVLDL